MSKDKFNKMLENILIKFAGAFLAFSMIGLIKYMWNALFGADQSDEPEGFEE